jgi:hypothetical protein
LSFSSVSTEVKAWVNFNGTGTPAIRASFNVSSITDNGTGDYTVNFTNATTDANYSMTANSNFPHIIAKRQATNFTTTSARINQFNVGEVLVDDTFVLVAIFR